MHTLTLFAALFLTVQDGPKGPKLPEGKLKVGDAADGEFARLDEKVTEKVKLSDFKDSKPVVLIFGSYT